MTDNVLARYYNGRNVLSQGPPASGYDKLADLVSSATGFHRQGTTTNALARGLDLATLGMLTGAYDGGRELADTGRPGALAMALMPGAKPVSKVIPKANTAARTAAAELWRTMRNSPYDYHGVRATENPLPVGERVPRSFEWDRDKPTDVELPGASTVGVDPYRSTTGVGSIPWALERMGYDVGGASHRWDYYAGPHYSVIGANKKIHGQDTGEWILDGDVLGRLSGPSGPVAGTQGSAPKAGPIANALAPTPPQSGLTRDDQLSASSLGSPGASGLNDFSQSGTLPQPQGIRFDDALIEIMRKYGLLPPLAAGGLGTVSQSDPAMASP